MSQEQQAYGYGFVSDSDESLLSKSGGNFGGNFGIVYIRKGEFIANTNADKPEEPVSPCLEFTFLIGDRETKYRVRPVTSVYINNERTSDFSSDAAKTALKAELSQNNACVVHILKALGVTEEAVKNTFSSPIRDFNDYAAKVVSLLPVGYQNIPLDLFMEYQWTLGTKADGSPQEKTYPTIPKNMKGGYWLVKAEPGKWEESEDEKGGLIYVNESGKLHTFKRDKAYMDSPKGTQQFLGQSSGTKGSGTPMAPAPGTAPKSDEDW
jgi:hypothetical protein